MLDAREQSRPKILVVEDSYLAAEVVCDMVKKCGWDVAATVGRVETGVEFLCRNHVDGAVVDIDLHGTTSFPICDQLSKRDIPFLFLTGYGANYVVPPEFQDRPRLSKPLNDHEFESAIAELASAQPASEVERGNLILERLSPADWRVLRPKLERVEMKADEVLEASDTEVGYVHFPVTGLISIRARSLQGKRIEVALVGREGAIGLAAMLGAARSAETEAVVQHPGLAWRLPVHLLAKLQGAHPDIYQHLLAAVHGFFGQIARNSLAIGYGTIEQRLARRLLMASVRLGTRSLSITHDGLSRILAVRRSGVTVALHMLESRRVIRARRNRVEILDYGALMREAGDVCWWPDEFQAGSIG